MKLLGFALISFGLISSAYAAQQTSAGEPSQMLQPTAQTQPLSGNTFLEENKKKPGVITLPDGLQYKILVEGKGAKPTTNDVVTVNYAGKLTDGTEFDSSYNRGEPATFPVSGVIKGWTEALQLMSVGSTWELYIPPQLAYGEEGAPPAIGPNQTLIFKVELLGIKKS